MTLDTMSILGASGRIADRLEHYEHRPQQLQMADAVQRAIAEKSHLLVEAGPGRLRNQSSLAQAIRVIG